MYMLEASHAKSEPTNTESSNTDYISYDPQHGPDTSL